MSPFTIFIIGLAAFLLLSFAGMPIAFAFLMVAFVGTACIMGLQPALFALGSAPWQWASQQGFIVMPLFILMGQFAFYSGISRDLYSAAYKWLGRLPGGLALATNVACTGFAACTGSSLASGATMGVIAYPEMMRFNYDRGLATGCISAGGTLGFLIPPSLMFIIYGILTQQPVGVLFIAGIFPGLLLSGLFFVLILIMCTRNPKLGPRGEPFSWRDKFMSLKGIWGMLVLFALVMGGLYIGIFAPSEAGAIGAFGALVIALSKRVKVHALIAALRGSLRLTSMVLTITIGAMMFNTFATVSGFSAMFGTWVIGLPLPRYGILILILFIYIPLGMVMDCMGMILLTVPIIFPVIMQLGFDPIWFGVLIVLISEIAEITPPVGMMIYVIEGVTKVPMEEIFRGNFPFVAAMLVAIAILVAFPQISLFLTGTMG